MKLLYISYLEYVLRVYVYNILLSIVKFIISPTFNRNLTLVYFSKLECTFVFSVFMCRHYVFLLPFLCFSPDMDECVTGNHSCMQNCHNTDGSYRCSCKAGFKLLSDGMSCEGM